MTIDEKKIAYSEVRSQLISVLADETDSILKMATVSSVLKDRFPLFDWVGFYRVTSPEHLTIGPYQGFIGCLHIPFGKGVCGTAATTRATQIALDVDEFPGHIACDARSRSEIVLPVLANGELIAVLDIDSHTASVFDETDALELETLVREIF